MDREFPPPFIFCCKVGLSTFCRISRCASRLYHVGLQAESPVTEMLFHARHDLYMGQYQGRRLDQSPCIFRICTRGLPVCCAGKYKSRGALPTSTPRAIPPFQNTGGMLRIGRFRWGTPEDLGREPGMNRDLGGMQFHILHPPKKPFFQGTDLDTRGFHVPPVGWHLCYKDRQFLIKHSHPCLQRTVSLGMFTLNKKNKYWFYIPPFTT